MAKGLYTTVPQVVNAVTAFRGNTTFTSLKSRWESDFDLYRLKPYDAGKGYYAFTSNAPYGQMNKLLATLSQAKLLVRVPPDATLTEQERTIANNIEKFIYGSINNNDDRRKINGQTSIREELAWNLTLRGSTFVRVFVYKAADGGQTEVDITPWDSYAMAYGQGVNGLSWACHIRQATKEQIEDEYEKVFDKLQTGQNYPVYDYWDKASNAVFVDENTVLKPFTSHGLDFCPVYQIVAGWMPQTWHDHYTDTEIHRGESALAGARDLFKIKSKVISDWLNIFRRGVKMPLGYWSLGGTKTIEDDIYKTEEVAIIPMDNNPAGKDEIKPLFDPSMPRDAGPIMEVLTQEEHQVLFNEVAFGSAPDRMSGFAISNLQDAMLTIVEPYINALQDAYQIISLSTLKQFGASSFQPVKVRGRTSTGKSFGMPQAVELAPKDIDPNWYPEITLTTKLPQDDAERFNLAAIAKKAMLLSDETIQDRILGIEDTDVEKQRMVRDSARKLPTIMLYNAFLEAQNDGRPDIAQHCRLELTRQLAAEGITNAPGVEGAEQPGSMPPQMQAPGQQPMQQMSPTPQLPTQLQQLAAKLGRGTPGSTSGMPSNVLPQESQGGVPPGAMNAIGA